MKKNPLKKTLTKITKATKTVKVAKLKNSFLNKLSFLKKGSLTSYLVLVIIVFAFFLGMLTNKVSDLQQQVKDVQAQAANTATAPGAGISGVPAVDPAPAGPVNVSDGNYPALGNTNAKVTVVEFADFRCPFCEQWFRTIEPSLMKDYIKTGKVKFYFRNYAFLGPASTLAAEAGECANAQGKFWAFHDYMYKNQPDETDTSMYTVANLSNIAGNLGMDQSQFQSCLSSHKYANAVANDLKDGQTAGVNGTPTTFINGVPVVGAVPYSQIKQQIDAALTN